MSWCGRPRWASSTTWRRSRSLRSVVVRKSCCKRSCSAAGKQIRIIGTNRSEGEGVTVTHPYYTGRRQPDCESEPLLLVDDVAQRLAGDEAADVVEQDGQVAL